MRQPTLFEAMPAPAPRTPVGALPHADLMRVIRETEAEADALFGAETADTYTATDYAALLTDLQAGERGASYSSAERYPF